MTTTLIDWQTRMYMLIGLLCASAITATAPEQMFTAAAYATATLFILVVFAEITGKLMDNANPKKQLKHAAAAIRPAKNKNTNNNNNDTDNNNATTNTTTQHTPHTQTLPRDTSIGNISDEARKEISEKKGVRWVVGNTHPVKEIVKAQTKTHAKFVAADRSEINHAYWEISAQDAPRVRTEIETQHPRIDVAVAHPEKVTNYPREFNIR